MITTRVWISAMVFVTPSLFFGQQPSHSAQGDYSIRGVVVSATTGKPLDRAEITLSTTDEATKIAETTTSESGSFNFDHMSQGRYALHASRPGYIAANYNEHDGFFSAIVTGPGLETTDLRFKLLPSAVIDGTVTDDAGDPVRNAQVTLYRQNLNDGQGKIAQAGSTQTDDIGEYEFSRLESGDYFMSVSAAPWYAIPPEPKRDAQGNLVPDHPASSPLDVAYPLTFYDQTTDSDLATPIPVRAGDHLQLNFSLRAVPALHLQFRIPDSARQNGQIPPMLMQNIFGEQVPLNHLSYAADNSGDYEISGISAGHYEIRHPGPNGQGGSTSDIDLTADATIDSPPAADAGLEIRGKVAIMSEEDLPAPMFITLNSSAKNIHRGEPTAKDGTFTMQGIPQGTYEVIVNGPGTPYSIVRMAADGASTEGHLLKVGPSPTNLAILLTQDSATVNGYAKQNGKGISGVMVVLVPHDPGANRELFRRDQSDSDGSFSLKSVAPGAYTLVAIADGWTLDWARPEVIERYLSHGLKLDIASSQKNLNVSEPVEVQSR
jgi:Carboxypeptidase regulatory-like domain